MTDLEKSPSYRADIDCLRAVAVLLVIGFHWQLSGLDGGYVGVDVFFVVSGYLITRLIAGGMLDGSFSFADFYLRRARRLLPALYLVLLGSAAIGWFILLPTGLLDLARSAVAVVLFCSNVLFWQETGYFDAPAIDKPLLHTWSLSVEEQFYFVVPAALWLLMAAFRERKAMIVAVLAGTAALSFALSCWQTVHSPSAAFYLPTSRAWEFLIGSSLLVFERWSGGTAVRSAALLLGAAMIIAAGAGFGRTTPFPGPAALLPCIGTALVIWARPRPAPGRGAAALEAGAFVGRLSYSLYLWHWPLYVFARARAGSEADLNGSTKAWLFAATIALSLASYFAVEKPCRTRRLLANNRAFVGTLSLLATGFIGLTVMVFLIPGLRGSYGAEAARLAAYSSSYPYAALYRLGTCFLRPEQSAADYDRSRCFSVDPRRPNVLIWGDSMAAHYVPGLSAFADRAGLNLLEAAASICPPLFDMEIEGRPHCKSFNEEIGRLIFASNNVVVLLSADWSSYEDVYGTDNVQRLLKETLRRLGEHGVPAIVFGRSIRWRQELPKVLAQSAERNAGPVDTRSLVLDSEFARDDRMRAGLPGVRYISILDAVCPLQTCPAFVGEVPFAFDKNHLTREASIQVIDVISPQLRRALER